MKLTVCYYSATGNSLYVAKSLGGITGEYALVSMPAMRRENTVAVSTDSLGLVFPMHYFGLPPLVSQFIAKLDLASAEYIFAVVTCGSPSMSGALHQLSKLLAAQGKQLDAGFHVGMISNYLPLSAIPAEGRRQKILAKADEKVQRIAQLVLAKRRVIEPEYFWLPCLAVNSYWRNRLLAQARHKFSASATCTACGYCEQVCPADNIRLVDGRPQWRDYCQECLACLHVCPVKSIEFGTRTSGRARYRHPQISAAELIQSKISR